MVMMEKLVNVYTSTQHVCNLPLPYTLERVRERERERERGSVSPLQDEGV